MKIKLILAIPMLLLATLIFNEVINKDYDIWYKIIISIFGAFFIYEPIRILLHKTK